MPRNILLETACLLFVLIFFMSARAGSQTFTLKDTITIDFGSVWCLPVYDGSNIVVSSESGGSINAGKFDLSLNQTDSAITVADASDVANNDTIADHKHIFQDSYHYLVFSNAGSGQGGYLYLLKLDTDLNRVGITTVVSNDPPTNDMLLVGDGTYVYVGKFLPGTGHRVYKYDANLVYQNSFEIGGGVNTHANGASSVYTNNQFHLVAPFSLVPGENDEFYRIIFDNNWNIAQDKTTILTDEGMLGIVSALSVEPDSQEFIIHYGRGSSDKGGPLYRAVYDSDWELLSNVVAVNGTWTRPHSIIVDDTLYVGYDGSSVQLSSFNITAASATPTPSVIPTATPSETPVATAVPVCEADAIAVSPDALTLGKKENAEVVVTVKGADDCPVEGETVSARIKSGGKRLIKISSTSGVTDDSGNAAFTITARRKSGKTRVTFQAAGQTKSITVTVKK